MLGIDMTKLLYSSEAEEPKLLSLFKKVMCGKRRSENTNSNINRKSDSKSDSSSSKREKIMTKKILKDDDENNENSMISSIKNKNQQQFHQFDAANKKVLEDLDLDLEEATTSNAVIIPSNTRRLTTNCAKLDNVLTTNNINTEETPEGRREEIREMREEREVTLDQLNTAKLFRLMYLSLHITYLSFLFPVLGDTRTVIISQITSFILNILNFQRELSGPGPCENNKYLFNFSVKKKNF